MVTLLLWGEFRTFSVAKANHYSPVFIIPPATHHCWVDRGSKEKVCLTLLYMASNGNQTPGGCIHIASSQHCDDPWIQGSISTAALKWVIIECWSNALISQLHNNNQYKEMMMTRSHPGIITLSAEAITTSLINTLIRCMYKLLTQMRQTHITMKNAQFLL